MRRRAFIAALTGGLLAAPLAAEAQQPTRKIPRVGIVTATSSAAGRHLVDAFREGHSVRIEERWVEGQLERFGDLIADLLRSNVDVMVVGSAAGARAAKDATTTTPIVFVAVTDPIGSGVVSSLARPGGNLTGTSLVIGEELAGKWVELVKGALPRVSHVAALGHTDHPMTRMYVKGMEAAARTLRLTLQVFEVHDVAGLDSALSKIAKASPGALIVTASPLFHLHRRRISDCALERRIPTIGFDRQLVVDGVLLTYGPSITDSFRRRSSPHWVAFAQRLVELGYVEGRNVSIEFRSAEGRPERFPDLMSELVRLGADVILPVGPEASLRAAQKATTTVPIVVVAIDNDPIARGYVGGLARPGGNTTGVFLRQPELTPKRIELLKEVVPEVRRVVVFWDAFSADQLKEAELAAQSAGLQLQRFEFRDPPYSFDAPMRAAARQHAGALLGLASPIFFRQRAELAEIAIRNRLPAIVPFREAAEAGVLMAYGASLPSMLRRAAEYIDRILKGASPADLPMEQPTKFELVINLKTAKALGLTIPRSLLLRADQVIE